MSEKKNDKKVKKTISFVDIIFAIVVIVTLSIDVLLIVKTLENHRKDEALFSMDYYRKEETYKDYNDVFNYYEGTISKEDAIELGELVHQHNRVSKKNIYQIIVTLDKMKFYLKDDLDYSKYKECMKNDSYEATFKYNEETTLLKEINLIKK